MVYYCFTIALYMFAMFVSLRSYKVFPVNRQFFNAQWGSAFSIDPGLDEGRRIVKTTFFMLNATFLMIYHLPSPPTSSTPASLYAYFLDFWHERCQSYEST